MSFVKLARSCQCALRNVPRVAMPAVQGRLLFRQAAVSRLPVVRQHALAPLGSAMRHMSIMTFQAADLTPEVYHRLSDETLEHMTDIFEAIGDETDLPGYDIEYSQGVLTLKLGEHGTYVLNKQPPNRQIWLSSPKSGPKRYDYDTKHKKWFYHRDNHTLDELLNSELSEVFGKPIDLSLPIE